MAPGAVRWAETFDDRGERFELSDDVVGDAPPGPAFAEVFGDLVRRSDRCEWGGERVARGESSDTVGKGPGRLVAIVGDDHGLNKGVELELSPPFDGLVSDPFDVASRRCGCQRTSWRWPSGRVRPSIVSPIASA